MISGILCAVLCLRAQNPGDLSAPWKVSEVLPVWLENSIAKKLGYTTPLHRIARVTSSSVYAWDMQGIRDLAFESNLKMYLQSAKGRTFPAMFQKECRILYFRHPMQGLTQL